MSRPYLLVAAALVLGAGVSFAQTQTDLTGTWNLQTSVELPSGGGTCQYSGQTSLSQDGSAVGGFAELFLVSGPAACPAEMSASLTGSLQFGASSILISGSLSGQLGLTDFTGELSPNPGGGGTFDVVEGGFAGSAGTWTAQLLNGLAIPTLTPVGLTVLTLLLLASGFWVLGRQI